MDLPDDYNFSNVKDPRPDVTYFNPLDRTNKTAYLAGQTLLVVLNFLFNLVAIAIVVYLYVQRRETSRQALQLLPVLASALTHLGLGVWRSVGYLPGYSQYPFTCLQMVILEVSSYMLTALVLLLVAAVAAAETLRLQTFVALTGTVQKVLVAILIVLSVLYVFAVIIPIFITTRLMDPSQPCVEGTNYLQLELQDDIRMVLPVTYYLVPALCILLTCFALLVAYCTRRPASRSNWGRGGGYVVTYNAPVSSSTATTTPGHKNEGEKNVPVTADPSVTFNNSHYSQPLPPTGDGVPSNPGFSQLSSPLPQAPPPPRGFPFNVILAAVAGLALYFTSSYGEMADESTLDVWLAGTMLNAMVPVFVGLAWLLDSDIRAVWCCCKR